MTPPIKHQIVSKNVTISIRAYDVDVQDNGNYILVRNSYFENAIIEIEFGDRKIVINVISST